MGTFAIDAVTSDRANISGGVFLEVRRLSKSFNGERVLNNVMLTVDSGKILSVLGPSGCGKSTLLRIIAGLLRQDTGSVSLNGKIIDGIPAHKRNMGFVFQRYTLFPHMTVSANVEFGLVLKKVPFRERKRNVEGLLELVGLSGKANSKPAELSGGQQQRVALARALAIEPLILLLDEPFGALDAKIRRKIRKDLKRMQREIGFTAIFVTHDQEEAFEVGDETAVMHEGHIEQVGHPKSLYEHPRTPFVAKFIGNANLIRLPPSLGLREAEVLVRFEDVRLVKRYPDQNATGREDNATNPETRANVSHGHPEEDESMFRSRATKSPGAWGVISHFTFLGPFLEVNVLLDNGDTITSVMPSLDFHRRRFALEDKVQVIIKRFNHFSGVSR